MIVVVGALKLALQKTQETPKRISLGNSRGWEAGNFAYILNYIYRTRRVVRRGEITSFNGED
jgi:hypothetical protein